MEAKGNIRKEVFARRRAATQEEIQEKSRMIYEKITALPEFLDADFISSAVMLSPRASMSCLIAARRASISLILIVLNLHHKFDF